MDTDVLIVGAGPSGLALAVALERLGVRFRIIDQAPVPGTASRAIVVHARTLEFYDQFGFGDDVVAAGLQLTSPSLWKSGVRRATIRFGDIGGDLSPHPYVLMYPQDAHERLLIRQLKTPVERPKVLAHFTQDGNGVVATMGDGEVIRAQFICGCDGAHSRVREVLGAGFPGGTYEDMFYVADVDVAALSQQEEFYFFLSAHGFLLALPLPGGQFRLIGVVPPEVRKQPGDMTFDDVAGHVRDFTPLQVTKLHWFSSYHVHHRVTDAFRHGRAFLLGDAAHIHSPVGGQGMNTGIGDAINLSWKLASVLHGGSDALLDTYDQERRAFARALVATTDRVFQGVVGHGLVSRLIRSWVMPVAVPELMVFRPIRRQAFKTVSQIGIQYRASALSTGHAGHLKAGDRLPWTGDNFVSLQAFDWQAHVYGTPTSDMNAYAQSVGLDLQVFPWSRLAQQRGLAQGAIYLIRPDGYIGFAGSDTTALRRYCARWGISSRIS